MDFAEELKIWVPVVSFLLSALALTFTRRTWFESNRPIVTAEIVTHGAGNMAIAFDLVVHNTGNRPAVAIRLEACESDLNRALNNGAPTPLAAEIRRCFSDRAAIPLLHQGKSAQNGFGATSSLPSANALVINSEIPIRILYKDLNGRTFKSKQTLVVKDSTWFAGSGWSKEAE